METTIQKGWSYISAIFQVLLQESDKRESLIEPQYIFRGITKRWFSTSVLIEKNKEKIIDNIRSVSQDEDKIGALSKECQRWIKQLQLEKVGDLDSKELYEFMYERFKHAIKTEEKKLENDDKGSRNKSFELLSMIMSPPEANGDDSMIHQDFVYCVPEYINSGAVVRLKDGSPHPSNLDFVNYIKHMLNDLKIRFPEYTDANYTDIEILADVQHKGAATCLADFSTNFLTTLWFATQEYDEEIGYLFCYDINKALIEDDKLFILNKNHIERSIEDLLYETSKGNKSYRNWLWQPSNLNERIAMQDSVFIFGLEPFKIEDNKIIVIPIPPDWKKPIQYVLRMFFGITAESVFCDVEGYSDANSKTRPYTKTFMHYFNDKYGLQPKVEHTQDSDSGSTVKNEYSIDYLQCGMDCLFQGEYTLALEYFKYYKAITGNDFKKVQPGDADFDVKLKKYILSVEVMYSKAICLKHTDDEFGAIHYYENTIMRCNSLQKKMNEWVNPLKDNASLLDDYTSYLEMKKNKAFHDLIGMFFTTHQYDKVITRLKKKAEGISCEINNALTSPKNDKDIKSLINDYLFYVLKIKEAQCCHAMKKVERTDESTDLKEYFDRLDDWGYILKDNQPLLFVLSTYFDKILEIMDKQEGYDLAKIEKEDEEDEFEDDENVAESKDNAEPQSFKKARSISYTNKEVDYDSPYLFANWDLRNIEKLVHEVLELDLYNDYKDLRDQTDKIHDFITFIQSKVKSARS